MIRPLLAALILSANPLAAQAQLRTIPADAAQGTMRHLQDMVVDIDGTAQRLAPGAQIRDAANRLVLPAALMPGSAVRYKVDATGLVNRVWILSPQEAAQPQRR